MHLRFSVWMAFFAFVAASTLRAQTPAAATPAAQAAMPPGQIVVAKVVGKVSMLLNGTTTELHTNDRVNQSATVITANESSVILVFSNGATTQLGADTSLVIDEFLQDPFKDTVAVSSLTEEPTRSHTKLHLTKGELIGQVKHLHQDQGSTFTIETPVGAAGIRGTTFRIVFRPSGTGMAFAIFSVSTVEGNVLFSSSGSQGQPSNPQGGGSQRGGSGDTRGGSVAVTTGQEVVVNVSVDVDPKTGQVVVTAPVQLATTTPLNPVVRASIVSQAVSMATTVEESGTTFSSGSTSGGQSSGSSSSSGTSTDSGKGDGQSSGSQSSDGTSSGSTSDSSSGSTSSGASDSTGSTSSSASTSSASTPTSSVPVSPKILVVPPPKTSIADLTPGAGS